MTIAVNSSVSSQKDTVYWCTAHVAELAQKIQIIGFEVLVEDELANKYTHHLILHRCTGNNIGNIVQPFIGGPGGECYSREDPIFQLMSHCNTYFYVWSRGGDRLLLPESVGLPVGESGNEYFLVEVHYDNPNLDQDVHFETGIKVFYANGADMRPIDGGLLHVGHKVAPSLTIPPNVQNFTAVGHCSAECTNSAFPSTGINIFNVLLHSHLNARKLKLRHFRNGQELPWIAVDNQYDFNYQQNRPLREDIKLLPGDHLSYECTYDTTWENPPSASHGGLSTRHEMCETFLLYWPKIKTIDVCQSVVASFNDILKSFGIEAMNTRDPDTPIVTAPAELAGLTYEQVLNTKVNWTPELLDQIQEQLRFSTHQGTCSSHENGLLQTVHAGPTKYPEISEPFQPPEPDCGNQK